MALTEQPLRLHPCWLIEMDYGETIDHRVRLFPGRIVNYDIDTSDEPYVPSRTRSVSEHHSWGAVDIFVFRYDEVEFESGRQDQQAMGICLKPLLLDPFHDLFDWLHRAAGKTLIPGKPAG